jgi:uncharacterized protein (DUF983 family)
LVTPLVTPLAKPALPPVTLALKRGALGRCPVCGEGKLYSGYLKIVPRCAQCDAPLGQLRADDAPPYFTILLTGHILVPGVLWVEKMWQPPMWLHMVVWLPLFTVICMALLPPIKGAVVGWMVTLGLTGEEHGPDPAAAAPPRQPGPPAPQPHV